MSFDLLNDRGEEMSFNNSGWAYLLELARSQGFEWPTRVDGEDVEALSAGQAIRLADAIAKGIGAGSDEQVAARVSQELTARLVIPSNSPNYCRDPSR